MVVTTVILKLEKGVATTFIVEFEALSLMEIISDTELRLGAEIRPKETCISHRRVHMTWHAGTRCLRLYYFGAGAVGANDDPRHISVFTFWAVKIHRLLCAALLAFRRVEIYQSLHFITTLLTLRGVKVYQTLLLLTTLFAFRGVEVNHTLLFLALWTIEVEPFRPTCTSINHGGTFCAHRAIKIYRQVVSLNFLFRKILVRHKRHYFENY